ncbi:SDR family oxidoreductase [Pseudonocardia sp. NPDC049154]|uniref:SDR family NAD(P)-dependent oxidoreductase n=1 Tax=Pseudonocardia sp. NPDC049154 TaxID=3155501 RepID=UPI0033FAC7D4
MSDFDGKSVIVTGAATGLGRAAAERFARLGARVLVADIDEAGAKATADAIGDAAHATALDVRDREAMERTVDLAVSLFGGLDVMVNNAGVASLLPFAALTHEEFDRLLTTNLWGTFNGMKAAVPALTGRGGGAIVNVASTAGLNGIPMLAGYGATKAAVINLSKTAAVELRPQRIRVNCVCPAFVQTALSDDLLETFQRMTGSVAGDFFTSKQGRLGQPEDVARAITHLAEDAGDWVTGTTYVLDGGLTSSQF